MKFFLIFVLLMTGSLAHAGNLAVPQGPIILTVSGNITHTNSPNSASFDRSMLDALAQRQITASTPWFEGSRVFDGPLGSAILDAVGANGSMLRVIALNEYAANVPVEDVEKFPLVFATRLDGQVMTVRDKGPLFLIYPFDEFPELFNEIYFGRSVWQISRIEVID